MATPSAVVGSAVNGGSSGATATGLIMNSGAASGTLAETIASMAATAVASAAASPSTSMNATVLEKAQQAKRDGEQLPTDTHSPWGDKHADTVQRTPLVTWRSASRRSLSS